MPVVRAAEHRDALAAVDVLCRSITELCVADHRNDPSLLEPWLANKTVENFCAWLEAPGNWCVVSESDGVVNGVGLVSGGGEILLCYVDPESVGCGCGAAILTALEEEAFVSGVFTLTLASTATARGFYEKHGYVSAPDASTCTFGVQCYPYRKRLKEG